MRSWQYTEGGGTTRISWSVRRPTILPGWLHFGPFLDHTWSFVLMFSSKLHRSLPQQTLVVQTWSSRVGENLGLNSRWLGQLKFPLCGSPVFFWWQPSQQSKWLGWRTWTLWRWFQFDQSPLGRRVSWCLAFLNQHLAEATPLQFFRIDLKVHLETLALRFRKRRDWIRVRLWGCRSSRRTGSSLPRSLCTTDSTPTRLAGTGSD